MLRECHFEPVYATGEVEPIEFYIQGLINSTSFDLALGFFSSSGFRALALGFAIFIRGGGKMRIIINDSLSKEDKEALQKEINQSESEFFEELIINDIVKLKETLSGYGTHFFNCISWLIANQRLEIISIIPKGNRHGIAHPKFGIFTDKNGDKASFSGSVNFSERALFHNLEAISCDYSWQDKSDLKRVNYYENLFEKTWNGKSNVAEIIPLERVKTKISEEFPTKNLAELEKEESKLVEGLLISDKYKPTGSLKVRINELLETYKKEDAALKEKIKNAYKWRHQDKAIEEFLLSMNL
jgi:hypothetical protein